MSQAIITRVRAIAAAVLALADTMEAAEAPAPTPVPVPPAPPAPVPQPPPAPVPQPPPPAPVPVPIPPPPPPPPTPTPTNRIPLLPIAKSTTQLVGPADWVEPSKLPAHMPWDIFDDDKHTIAKPMGGVEATDYRILHTYGMASPLYNTTQAIVNGRGHQVWPDFGDDWKGIQDALAQYPMRPGPRGECIASPYTTWHGHTRIDEAGVLHDVPQIPMWVGVAWDGTFLYAMRDGSIQRPFKVPVTTYASDFTYHEPRAAKILFTLDSAAGRVLKVDRSATTPVITELCRLPDMQFTSIRSVGGMLYVAAQPLKPVQNTKPAPDNMLAQILKVDPATGVASKLCDMPMAFWVDHDSAGQLVVMTLDKRVCKVNPETGSIGGDLLGFANPGHTVQFWVQCDVDRNGTWGEKDGIICIASHGTGNTDLWRITSKGPVYRTSMFGPGGSQHIGRAKYCLDPTGHYPWVAAHHPDDAVIMVQGFSNDMPHLIAAKATDATWPVEAPVDADLWARGSKIVRNGCAPVTPIGSVPSFGCLMNTRGGSHIGISADYIASLGYQQAAEFVRSGMGGAYRRDDIQGQDMRALLLYLYRCSMRYLKEGKGLIDGLMGQQFAGTAIASPAPREPNPNGTDWFLRAQPIAGGKVQIEGLKPTWPTTLPADLVVRVYVDKDQPTQQVIEGVVGPWTVTLPLMATGPHSLFVEWVSGGTAGATWWGRATTVEV